MQSIRNLIDLIIESEQPLIESTGLAGRKPGDPFKNSKGEIINFREVIFFPEKGGKLSPQQLDDSLQQLSINMPDIEWQNNKTGKTGGYAIASFDTPDGEVLHFGFFKDSISPSKTNNYVPNKVGDYSLATKGAEKMKSGLTPQDLLISQSDLTKEDIISQLTDKLGANNPLVQVAIRVANGEKYPIKFSVPPGVSFTAFRDYFCEMLQPIALVNGQYTGNAGEAAERFMDGSFENALISFDAAKNAGLSDSILTNPDGKYVKLSSKGARGAQASVKNLIDSVKELDDTPAGKKLRKKYKEVIDIIEDIQEKGQSESPLYLGVKTKVITEKEADVIRKLKNKAPVNMKNISKLNLGKNLTELAVGRQPKNPASVDMYYHLLASVAALSAIEINDNTNFSKAAADILNNGALVQTYSDVKPIGTTEWELKSFHTVYPSTAVKGVYLSAQKNYSSTTIKGNFTFKIDKGAGVAPEDNEEAGIGQPLNPAGKPDLAVMAKQVVEPKVTPEKKKEPAGPGRKKRKK